MKTKLLRTLALALFSLFVATGVALADGPGVGGGYGDVAAADGPGNGGGYGDVA